MKSDQKQHAEPTLPAKYSYREMILRLAGDGTGGLRAHTLVPENGGSTSFQPPFRRRDLASLSPQLFKSPQARTLRSATPSLPQELGEELFDSLFKGQVGRTFDRLLGWLEQSVATRRLRLRLVFDPQESGVAELAALPWELLYDKTFGGFLGQKLQISLTRCFTSKAPTSRQPCSAPLRVLVVKAQTAVKLDLEAEERKIRKAWETNGSVKVEVFRVTDRDSLRDRLRSKEYHVVHFMGHGDFDPETGEGHLWIEGKGAQPERLNAAVLAGDLSDLPATRLVVLNACQSAYHSCQEHHDPYGGIATALVQHGVPAVVAMQFKITDEAAIAFSGAFYRALARNEPVDAAVVEGRKAIFSRDQKSLQWAIPALFLSAEDGQLFDLTGTKPAAKLPELPLAETAPTRRPRHRWATWAAGIVIAGLLALASGKLLHFEKKGPTSTRTQVSKLEPAEDPLPTAADNPPECPSPEGLDIAFVLVPPGSVTIGEDNGPSKKPLPLQTFTLRRGLCVSVYEVTEALWYRVMGLQAGTVHAGDYPISGVSAEAADEFIRLPNHKDPYENALRLPTDEEWEYIARAGSATPYLFDSSEAALPGYANCKTSGNDLNDGYDNTAPVASFVPNDFGIYDLYGNVFEWVTSTAKDVEPGQRVRRGGSFNSTDQCSPGSRSIVSATHSHYDSGLRLVRDPIPVD